MPQLVEENGLGQRARWLIRLRWPAGISVAISTFVCARLFGISLQERALYGIAGLLLVYNTVVFTLLGRATRDQSARSLRNVKRLINVQISADLVILTALLHFSGGVENPFVFFFIFHMIIASILLSVRASYLQATLAILLFGLLVLLEHQELIPHYCLKGYVIQCRYEERAFLLGTFAVFAITLYLVVYMASYIMVRLRRAEEAQRQANALLCEKDRIKDEYVARLTHDIKGHLATIQTCLDVAVIGGLNDRTADFVNRAYRRTQKLTAFVKMLLTLTRLRLNGSVEVAVFPLCDAVRNAIEAVRRQAEERSISLGHSLVQTADAVSGNRTYIEETVTHLLLNAIKYTPEHGTVEIEMYTGGTSIVLQISDTGIGVPEAEQAKIFDEFYRASNARDIERDGTGLGLSLAKRVVELYGGSISSSSRQGGGAMFCMSLPLARPESVPEPAATHAGSCV